MIDVAGWDDEEAFAVLSDLDPHDALECMVDDGTATALGRFAIFRDAMARGGEVAVVRSRGEPFAVLALVPIAAGVAGAGLLARDHRRWRRPLAVLAARIRRQLAEAAASGRGAYRRVEARTWADHPTGARLLEACGFRHECDLRGYGQGHATFRQYAWVMPDIPETP